MEKANIKKVIVELENGNKLEFDKQVIILAEDEMSETEKRIHTEEKTKICCIANCSPNFMAEVTESMLGTLRKHAPGLDDAVMLAHLEKSSPMLGMLAELLGN